MTNIIRTKMKIPPSRKLGNNFTASGANTVLAVVGHGINVFRIDDNSINSTIYNWLEQVNFPLKMWNEARQEIGLVSPKTRSKIDLAMRDVVENYDFNKIFIIHPDDYFLIPGLSSVVITLNLSAPSSVRKTETKPAETKKVSYSTALKTKNLKPKSGPVKGTNHLKIGVEPTTLFLHLKLYKQ